MSLDLFALAADELWMRLRRLYLMALRPKYFHKTPLDQNVLKFTEILHETKVSLAQCREKEWCLNCQYKGKIGKIRQTKIFLHNEFKADRPSFLIHHGAGQFDYSYLIEKGLGKVFMERFNIFSVKAQHHKNRKDYLENCMASFLDWQLTFAGSVLAIEEARKLHNKKSRMPFIAAGVSMGGIAASLHFLIYDSADMYFPLIAYPNAGEIFLSRAYETAVGNIIDRRKNKSYRDSFTIKKRITGKDKGKVFPVLAKYDWYIDYRKAKSSWKGFETLDFGLGHASIVVKMPAIRNYILEKISRAL